MRSIMNYCSRTIFFRTETDKMLSLSMAFSGLLVLARVSFSGEHSLLFLVWNLFLAWIPYVITTWLTQRPGWIENRLKFVLAFAAWLLFIPNSFYLLTDLFHLGYHPGAPLWFDLMLIVSFAWNGLLLGMLSVRQMEKIITGCFLRKNELLFIYPVMWLNALGVYIGRYLRFNSWDVITNPFGLLSDIAELILHPVRYIEAWGMIGCFSVLMTLMYVTVKRISKAAK